jgi:prepilin-type N-terminal cleavage/methylation domain-containing protein
MKKGFTLVEIIIAMMIFSIVAVVALAALVKIIDANKKAQTTQDAVTTLSFALEAMSREMRSGSNYYCKIQAGGGATLNLWSDSSGLRNQLINECSSAFGTNTPIPSLGNVPAQAIVFAFTSPTTILSGAGSPCHPTYAYRLRRPNTSDTNWFFEKSEQTACTVGSLIVRSALNSDYSQSAQDNFSSTTPNSVSINGYYIQMTNSQFPLLSLSLSGYAGVKEQSKSYFTVETANAPRVP